MSNNTLPELIKVSHETFLKFLDSHENKYWDLADETSPDTFFDMSKASSDEIFEKLQFYSEGYGYIFLTEADDPYSIVGKVDLENIPEVSDHQKLYNYTIRGLGRDYLYFAYSEIQASNGFYLNLMLVDD